MGGGGEAGFFCWSERRGRAEHRSKVRVRRGFVNNIRRKNKRSKSQRAPNPDSSPRLVPAPAIRPLPSQILEALLTVKKTRIRAFSSDRFWPSGCVYTSGIWKTCCSGGTRLWHGSPRVAPETSSALHQLHESKIWVTRREIHCTSAKKLTGTRCLFGLWAVSAGQCRLPGSS